MTDNEIMFAVSNYVRGAREYENGAIVVSSTDMIAINDLINRQQAEVERLKKQDVTAEKIIREQGGTILTLKDENSRLFDRNCELSEKGEKAVIACIAARNEAIKEFAERLKERARPTAEFCEVVLGQDIDNLVKEIIGE